MPNLKKTGLIIASLAIAWLVLPANAHLEKKLDRNGGHWDYYGYYHCHDVGCRQAPDRFDFTTGPRLSNRNQDLYYNEEDWPFWLTTGGCQTVRTQILEATSDTSVTWTNPRHCEIREGHWTDPYTGDEHNRAARLEVDHIVPPEYANASNGYQWDDQTRAMFANDPINLVAVGRDIHEKKRDRGIGTWLPPAESYHCEYAAAWRDVAIKYDLDLFPQDKSKMNTILDGCDIPPSDIEPLKKKGGVDIRAGGIPVPI